VLAFSHLKFLPSGFFYEYWHCLWNLYFIRILCRLWGTFLADVVIQMLGTDYARILRAIYAFAQVIYYYAFLLICHLACHLVRSWSLIADPSDYLNMVIHMMVIGIVIPGLSVHLGWSVVVSSLSLRSLHHNHWLIWLLSVLNILVYVWYQFGHQSNYVDLHVLGFMLVDHHHTLGLDLQLPSFVVMVLDPDWYLLQKKKEKGLYKW